MLTASIDIGKHHHGLAVWQDKLLFHAELVGSQGGQPHPLLESSELIVELLFELSRSMGQISTVAIEKMQVYDSAQQKGRQSDLIDLSICTGAVMFGCKNFVSSFVLYTPAEWKKQVPKKVMEDRIKKKLTDEEKSYVNLPARYKAHNVYDGIGIGLFHHGRL